MEQVNWSNTKPSLGKGLAIATGVIILIGLLLSHAGNPTRSEPTPTPPASPMLKLILAQAIQRYGYQCGHADMVKPFLFSRGYHVDCDIWDRNDGYQFDVEDKGGKWFVTVR